MAQASRADRRFPRIATPQGVWVAWTAQNLREVSRVCDLNEGGMFISTGHPQSVGTQIALLLMVLEGEIKAHATVRNRVPGKGMGVEITAMGAEDTARFRNLLSRLFATSASVPS